MAASYKKVALSAAALVSLVGVSPGIANASESDIINTPLSLAEEGPSFELSSVGDGIFGIDLTNAKFAASGDGTVIIEGEGGDVIERLPNDFGEYTITSVASLILATPQAKTTSTQTPLLTTKGFCLFGRSNGRCRGAAVAEQAAEGGVRGTVTGAIGGCVAGLILTPAGCIATAAPTAIAGGAAGAVDNVLQNARK